MKPLSRRRMTAGSTSCSWARAAEQVGRVAALAAASARKRFTWLALGLG